jgi:hypothetical protein
MMPKINEVYMSLTAMLHTITFWISTMPKNTAQRQASQVSD